MIAQKADKVYTAGALPETWTQPGRKPVLMPKMTLFGKRARQPLGFA